MSAVMHQPRIAWDAAVLLVRAAQAESIVYTWCRDHVGALLGSAYRQNLETTRVLVTAPQAPAAIRDSQAAVWRVRLEDELRSQPQLAQELVQLSVELRARLAG
jgi:hypothetical protein